MKGIIIVLSIFGAGILLCASFISVIGVQTTQPSDVKASPLYQLKTTKANFKTFSDITSNYIGSDTEIIITQPMQKDSEFVRCDADQYQGVSMADALFILRYLYVPEAPTPGCMDAADANDDGSVNMADVRYLLIFLYLPGTVLPPRPFPDCGTDPTPDELDCQSHWC